MSNFETKVLAALEALQGGQAELRAELRSEVADLRAGQAGLRSDVAELRSEVADLRAGQAGLRSEFADLRAGLAEVRAELAALRSWLEQEFAAVWKAIDGLQRALAEHRAETLSMRVAIMERIDRLQNTLTAAKDEMIIQTGGIEHVRQQIIADRAAIAGLQEEVALLRRKITRLEENYD